MTDINHQLMKESSIQNNHQNTVVLSNEEAKVSGQSM
jgi:hypothetical protein